MSDREPVKKKNLILFCLLLVAMWVIIVLIAPGTASWRYHFQEGRIWQHDELVSPMDFAIKKAPEAIALEKQRIREQVPPYFALDTTAQDSLLIRLKRQESFSQTLKSKDKKIAHVTDTMLRHFFQSGIVSPSLIIPYDSTTPAVLLAGRVASQKLIGNFFTPLSAYQSLVKTLESISPPPRVKAFLESNKIRSFIVSNVKIDNDTRTKILNEKLSQVSEVEGMEKAGKVLIHQGEIISKNKYLILQSLKEALLQESLYKTKQWKHYLTQGLITFTFILILFFFTYFEIRKVLHNPKHILFFVLMPILFILLTAIITDYAMLNIWLVPLPLFPMLFIIFLGTYPALVVHLLMVALFSLWIPDGFTFFLVQVSAAPIIAISTRRIEKRSHFVYSSLSLFATYSILYFVLNWVKLGSLSDINYQVFAWLGSSSLVLLGGYPLMDSIEKIFGFTTNITLLELSNTNHFLLRKLANNAPGTFVHTLSVATLAEQATNQIGGNPLLARVGALYHDIGKALTPEIFIENQRGHSPHDKLSFVQSAKHVVNHVTAGYEMAIKAKLPKHIAQFILTHHGKGRAEFFYRKQIAANQGKKLDTKTYDNFCYPGPNPHTKEQTVVLLADSLEAATRSLSNPSEQDVADLVERIFAEKQKASLLLEADITFRELQKLKSYFAEKLYANFHTRISYPDPA